ncbi:hypothetical protein SAMN02745216_02266 [Desulfatibacillum alkenivorans DSM 16219]|uniref:Uncharacterized protein n=1 Tax=Desulfatibacillum alkenivorans DSM 16219 TaxID=1121393 RepID=A0A1M6M7K3_9BACT|nr:hypothetical protein [Desulfatibacillum alkenivorans]SHJ79442.1 hypothetical protein SAMN02745216_02266 [Desulfatibacillum alkenivorans DSM 16219]
MSQGKNIVTEPFTSPVKFLLGTCAAYAVTWIFSLYYLAGQVEGGMEALTANPFDIRVTLMFITVFGCVIGVATGLLSARTKGKNFAGTVTDGFLAGLAGVAGAWINWLWAFMLVIWTIIMALPVAFKAVSSSQWPGAKAFFAFFSSGPFNAGVLSYSHAFAVVWVGGAVMAVVFIFLFHHTLYDGFNPVFSKPTLPAVLGIVTLTGVLAVFIPQFGITLMGMLLAGSISVGPLLCIHDCLWSGNGQPVVIEEPVEV